MPSAHGGPGKDFIAKSPNRGPIVAAFSGLLWEKRKQNQTLGYDMNDTFAKLRLRDFCRDQDGAVTVDWVVLTAAAVFLGLGSAFVIAASVPQVAEGISGYMGTIDPSAVVSMTQVE